MGPDCLRIESTQIEEAARVRAYGQDSTEANGNQKKICRGFSLHCYGGLEGYGIESAVNTVRFCELYLYFYCCMH